MRQRGFSAVELIGALAILVILTALLLPRISRKANTADVIETVNTGHVIETVVAIQSLQTAVTAHIAQSGSLASQNGSPLGFAQTYDAFGQVLLSEGLIEKPFAVRLSTNAMVRLVKATGLSPTSAIELSNGAYDLDGDGKNDVVGAAFVVEAVLPGVKLVEARALNEQLDGPRLGENANEDDLLGRVVYRKPGAQGRTEVHIYIMRK